MENLKKVQYFNLINGINVNFEKVEDAINDLEEGNLVPQTNIANITNANLPVVPALADTAAVKTYLDSLYTPLEARLDNVDAKLNTILVALRAAGLLTV